MGKLKDSLKFIQSAHLADHDIRKVAKVLADRITSGKNTEKALGPIAHILKLSGSVKKKRKLDFSLIVVGYLDQTNRALCDRCFVANREHLQGPIEVLIAEEIIEDERKSRLQHHCISCQQQITVKWSKLKYESKLKQPLNTIGADSQDLATRRQSLPSSAPSSNNNRDNRSKGGQQWTEKKD